MTPARVLAERVKNIRGLVADWDGVFNDGAKGEGITSTYTEPDSMGTNLLRYALWRARSAQIPVFALVTGADNPTARGFARREHFHAVYNGTRDKTAAMAALCSTHRLATGQFVCIFDDVNDLGMASGCGIRVLVQRTASPLLRDYVAQQNLCDYITGHPAGRHAVREVCELLLGLTGEFDAVVASRVAWDRDYARYFAERQAVATEVVDQAEKV
jgi:3-deoxy-D-manno-octulosonate 8-phosphate phosphatase (KDO 8-P phosphatase)